MFQKFFTNTIISTYIKKLLNCSNIPLYKCVSDGDYVVKNITYIYNNNVITCTTSGVLPDSAAYKIDSPYYPDSEKYHYTYHSKYMYYDSDTHTHLGRYLRHLKNVEGINLMPYYNCFNHTILSDLHINSAGAIEQFLDDSYKVLAVPICFNKKYTVAIDSALPVRCTSVIYNNSGYDAQHALSSAFVTYPQCNFSKPFIYSVNIEDQINQFDLMSRESNLYLLVQVPSANTSSLVVLEGDYVNQDTRVINLEFLDSIENPYLHDLSLLSLNTNSFVAFSDRLTEYLLSNVIYKADSITDNIKRVQNTVQNFLDTVYYVMVKSDPQDSTKGTLIVTGRKGTYCPNTGIYTYLINGQVVEIFKGTQSVNNLRILLEEGNYYLKFNDIFYLHNIGPNITDGVISVTKYNTGYVRYNVSDHISGVWDNDLSFCINHITQLANVKYNMKDCDSFVNKDVEKILMEGI